MSASNKYRQKERAISVKKKRRKIPEDFLFGADQKLKAKKEQMRKTDVRRQWLADHIIDTLALIVAIIALIRTF